MRGPFLYLDGDTLVRADISAVFVGSTDVAAALNHSVDDVGQQVWEGDRLVLGHMGWKTSADRYVNGGVLFFNDGGKVKAFSKLWHDRWLESYQALGSYRDQPSLNSALLASGVSVLLLDKTYNAQFSMRAEVAEGAVVWHYYRDSISMTEFGRLASSVVGNGTLSLPLVSTAMRNTYPWNYRGFPDGIVAARIARRGYVRDAERLWLEGKRYAAVRRAVAVEAPQWVRDEYHELRIRVGGWRRRALGVAAGLLGRD